MSALIDRFELAELPARAQAFRQDVQAFLKAELPPLPADRRARSWMGFDAGFSRKLAARGWVGVTLPRAYGGAEMDAFSRFVLIEELLCAGAPVSAHWIADRQSGPQIRKFGSEAQRSFYLPRICRGEAFFCIGMSEPNSGSDLASVGTRATRRADGGWTLSGRKIWTTNAQHCHYMIALVRTSGTPQDRNQGLSQFIVDLSLPGVTVRPISDLAGDAHFSEVFFDDVQLSDEALIGQEGSGWEQVTAELAFERSGPERIYSSMVLLDGWSQWLRGRGDVSQTAAVGRYATHLAALRNLSLSVACRRREPGRGGRPGQGTGHHLRTGNTGCHRGGAGLGSGRRYRRRIAAHLRLCEPGVSHLLAAGRHARDPARHDRARPGPALKAMEQNRNV